MLKSRKAIVGWALQDEHNDLFEEPFSKSKQKLQKEKLFDDLLISSSSITLAVRSFRFLSYLAISAILINLIKKKYMLRSRKKCIVSQKKKRIL